MGRFCVMAKVGFVVEAESAEQAFDLAALYVDAAVVFAHEENNEASPLSSTIESESVAEGHEAAEAEFNRLGL
jgi:hypothetical protein